MKSILFLVLLATASAHPSAVVLPALEIQEREAAWLRANPSGWANDIHGKSMLPYIKDGDRVIYEAYIGQKLKGQWGSITQTYTKIINGKKVQVTRRLTHLIYDENATHVFMTGLNNSRSDGWLPKYDKNGKCLVNGVLVGILRKE